MSAVAESKAFIDSTAVWSTALPRFLLLYAAMYAAFGVASPFLPALVNARGLPAAQLGLVLSAGMAVRLLTAPLAGRLGDLIQGLRVVLVVCIVLAALVTLGYLPAQGFWPFLALSLLHAASLAPVTILADALALGAAAPPPGSGRRGFEYGWVRGTGSAAFIGGTLLGGQAVSAWGLDVIVGLQALLLGAAAGAALAVPELRHACTVEAVGAPAGGVRRLLRLPRFRQLDNPPEPSVQRCFRRGRTALRRELAQRQRRMAQAQLGRLSHRPWERFERSRLFKLPRGVRLPVSRPGRPCPSRPIPDTPH